MENRFCKRCLLDVIFEEAEYKNMKAYIESISEHIKTEEHEYARRLNFCIQCDNLINGMCKICGCFVEMRAAIKKNYCPDIEKKW